jgi:hypothetical protein
MGPFLSFHDSYNDAWRPIRPDKVIKQKTVVSAGGKAFIHLSL